MTSARDALLAFTKRRHIKSAVNIGDETAPIYLRWQSLSELEKARFESANQTKDGKPNHAARLDLRIRMIAACAVDEAGRRIFTDADIPELRKLDGRIVSTLSDEVMSHVGWTDNDVENLVKNSPETPDEGSP